MGGRRKGELTGAGIDRGYPHQVAVAATLCAGRNYRTIHAFCETLSLAPRGHTVRRDDVDYLVFCFAEKGHADLFAAHFGGEKFNPKDRGRGANWREWRRKEAQSSR